MNLIPNMVVEWLRDEAPPLVERIIDVDPACDIVWAIDTLDEKAWPVQHSYRHILAALASGGAQIPPLDPSLAFILPEKDITENRRSHRDRIREILEPLVDPPDWHMFYPAKRGPLVAQRHRSTGMSKSNINTYLRRYWQSGHWNGVLPRWPRCGQRADGKPREITAKLGRPSTITVQTGRPTGLNIDDATKERLAIAFKRFLDKPKTGPWRAYRRTMDDYFSVGYARDKHGRLLHGDDGKPLRDWLPADERPTFDQFKYHAELYRASKGRTPGRVRLMKKGPRWYNLHARPLLDGASSGIFGPGVEAQLDATILDVFVISASGTGRLIGKPVLHLLTDVFTRMIIGFSVTLEGPNWTGAMQAIASATEDKVTLCRRYGVPIQPHEWPWHYLPYRILGDRGELLGVNADALTKTLGVTVAIAAAFRPDWKPFVERDFRTINEGTIRFVPGATHGRQDGERAAALDAQLTIQDIRRLIIYAILRHNHNLIADYDPGKYGLADGVRPYPMQLLAWGQENSIGRLRTVPQERVERAVLPRVEAGVTSSGLHVLGTNLYYLCERALEEDWFVDRPEHKRATPKVTLAYHPHLVDVAYLDLGDLAFEPCLLNTKRSGTFAGWDWQDAEDHQAQQKRFAKEEQGQNDQTDAAYRAKQERVLEEAQGRAAGRAEGPVNRKDVRATRAEENTTVGRAEAWTPARLGVTAPTNWAPTRGQLRVVHHDPEEEASIVTLDELRALHAGAKAAGGSDDGGK